MENNARLDMKSYDRFLPNQDFLPKGGFGNLIALPLQGLARKSGNSVFVDESFEAFRDPKYYELLNARKPLYHTPSLVTCYEMTEDYIKLPRGCEDALIELLQSNFSAWEEDNQTNAGRTIDVSFSGELRPEQEVAVQRLLSYNNGVLAATTAFGKTVAAIGMIARRKTNTLILVHSKALLEQWKEEIEKFLIINEPELATEKKKGRGRKKAFSLVGLLDGSRNTLHGIIDIAVFNSALSEEGVKPHRSEHP